MGEEERVGGGEGKENNRRCGSFSLTGLSSLRQQNKLELSPRRTYPTPNVSVSFSSRLFFLL